MKITKKVIRVGDSKAIIIPKDMINGIKVGDKIEMDIKKIRKVNKNGN